MQMIMVFEPGVVIRRKSKRREESVASSGSAVQGCVAVRKFSRLTYWNHDTRPSRSDAAPRVMEWLDVADVLHRTRPSATST
jgi:ribonuclease H2 subunit C